MIQYWGSMYQTHIISLTKWLKGIGQYSCKTKKKGSYAYTHKKILVELKKKKKNARKYWSKFNYFQILQHVLDA
jgi:hypothetical protein